MKDGFVRAACATPDIRVADVAYNSDNIIRIIKRAAVNGIKLIVFPELCITGYTCGDLFLQRSLIEGAENQLMRIARETSKCDICSVVGLPYALDQKLYNVAAVISGGRIIGMVPKLNLPNHSEFYELRHFTPGNAEPEMVSFHGGEIPFGSKILFTAEGMDSFTFAVEICEDLWTVNPPSNAHALAGATIIANLSCSDELIAKEEYRRMLIKSQSARLYCGYLYADSGYGESTQDMVFSGDNIIAENGSILARSKRFTNECVYSEIDTERLINERRRSNTFKAGVDGRYMRVNFRIGIRECELTRYVGKLPFVPSDEAAREKRCEEILAIQSMGLKKRLDHTNAKTAVIGVSGGLDSTLALLVAVRAFDSLQKDRNGIIAVTMPCFGTTDRTYNNAVNFAKSLGVTLLEINIRDAVNQHFKDIDHDPESYDVTYENSQARERTQVLMDIANKHGGLVIGTGDLSELALGWATYNGDHMSMYAVNSGVPKTLIRYLVAYEAERTDNKVLEETLNDILATPVSPELLPPEDGKISQKTEQLVGPYELHDFFMYYLMRFGYKPAKVLRLAQIAFKGEYDRAFILSWMKVFYRRFFAQQFKRSCLPDGPKVGSVALSPRGDWRMPSDASSNLWMSEIERL